MNTIDRQALTVLAFEILVDDLHRYGNVLSGPHASSLLALVDLFSSFCTGEARGRKAFPLPTGMGKTSAIVAFITALDKLGYQVPVSVAASRVEALCRLQRDLIAHGVNPDHIGLAHREEKASEPSTGCRPEDARPFQLVTHARIRMGDSYFDLFGSYQGTPRALCLYDETLLRSDHFAFSADTVESALGALMPQARNMPALTAPVEYIKASVDIIRGALEQAQASKDPANRGIPIELPEQRSPEVIDLWQSAIGRSRIPKPYVEILGQLLDVSQEPLQVIPMQQGGGAIAIRQAVSSQLENVVILDASTPIRDLVAMDPTIEVVGDSRHASIKSFENLEVFQLLASGGRSSVEKSFKDNYRETSAVSSEVIAIIRGDLEADPKRCFLIFAFKRSRLKDLDIVERMRTDLRNAGLDPDSKEGDNPRYSFLTWGQHEGLNGFEFCETVILAGVLHQAHLDVAAAIKGQAGDLAAGTPNGLVTKVLKSEISHCIYQAASRGSCRRVNQGRANPMRLYLIHSDLGLKTSLDAVLPKAQWSYPEPRFLKKAAVAGRPLLILGQILEALQKLPEDVMEISSVKLRARLGGLPQDKATSHAFTAAVRALDLQTHGWTLSKKSLVRGAAAYGFTAQI
jgi:hypothetical protein